MRPYRVWPGVIGKSDLAVVDDARWLLPGTAQRNFALRSVTLSRPVREALDTRGRFKSSFRTWPLCRTRGNELGRHQRQLHRENAASTFASLGGSTARPITVKRCAPLAAGMLLARRFTFA
jgi:hypothetical protein